MTELKCPFCGEKLVRHWGMKDPALYCCDNPKCSKGGVGTEQSWKTLIDTKKKLDIAVDGITYMRNNCLNYAADYMDYADGILEQIKYKDVK